MNWEIASWIGGALGAVISVLLGVVIWQLKTDRGAIVMRMDKHEEWIMGNQKEIKELAKTTGIAIEHNATTIEFVKELMKESYKNKRR